MLLFGAAAASRWVLAVVRSHISRELYWDLSTGVFRWLQRLPLAYFDRVGSAHFAPLFDTELLTFSGVARDLFERGLQAVLQLSVIMLTLFVLNWPLALLVLLLLPLVAFPPRRKLGLTVIGAGAVLSFAELLSLGTFSAFILFLPILMRGVGDLAAFVQDLGRASLSLDRIEAVKHALLPEHETQASIRLGATNDATTRYGTS